ADLNDDGKVDLADFRLLVKSLPATASCRQPPQLFVMKGEGRIVVGNTRHEFNLGLKEGSPKFDWLRYKRKTEGPHGKGGGNDRDDHEDKFEATAFTVVHFSDT